MDIAGVGQPVRGFLLRIVQYLGREGQLWGVLHVGGGGYNTLGSARLGGGGVVAGVVGLGGGLDSGRARCVALQWVWPEYLWL